jgi:hypothetical protein
MEKSGMHRLGNVLAAFVIVLSGCANDRYAAPDSFCWKQGQRFLWDGAEVVGQSGIKINLVHQRAYFYKAINSSVFPWCRQVAKVTTRLPANSVLRRRTLTTPRIFMAITSTKWARRDAQH